MRGDWRGVGEYTMSGNGVVDGLATRFRALLLRALHLSSVLTICFLVPPSLPQVEEPSGLARPLRAEVLGERSV
jgi:hypothetical protein